MNVNKIDSKIISWLRKSFLPIARFAIFVVFFWFGALKLFGESPAEPIASVLVAKTFGIEYFELLFYLLAVLECIIGLLFLFPKLTRIVIPLLLLHLVIVSSPLLLVLELAWSKPFIPTLEGQYIIKNIAIIALAIGIAAQTTPLNKKAKNT